MGKGTGTGDSRMRGQQKNMVRSNNNRRPSNSTSDSNNLSTELTINNSKLTLSLKAYDDDLASITDTKNSTADNDTPNKSTFNNNRNIVSVDRNDLQKVSLLGKGHFCNVYLVTGALQLEYRSPSSSSSSSLQVVLSQSHEQRQEQERQVRKRKMYACKSLDLTHARTTEELIVAATDLAIEAKVLSQLDHKNIIKLRGVCSEPFSTSFSLNQQEGGYFLVLDVLTETLGQRLNRWKKDEDRVSKRNIDNTKNRSRRLSFCTTQDCDIVVDKNNVNNNIDALSAKRTRMYTRTQNVVLGIAQGMEYLASQGIVNRDLKPGNIGFEHNQSISIVKLFDFGMARPITECTDPNEICGSPRYMAPEVMKGEGYSLKVDVYSFGIILFELCSLEVPFAMHYNGTTNINNNKRLSSSASSSWWNRMLGRNKGAKAASTNTTLNKLNNVEDFYQQVIETELRPSDGFQSSQQCYASVLPCAKLRTLIAECWQTDPLLRPSFQEIVPRLQEIYDTKQ